MKLRKGSHNATGLKFGIVVSKFNKFVTSKLLSSCVEGLTKHGVVPEDISEWKPEIAPQACAWRI